MESAVAVGLYVLSAILLGGSALRAFRAGRLSAVVVAGLAIYAVILVFSAGTLLAEFGASRYLNAAVIYTVGTLALLATLQLAAPRRRWLRVAPCDRVYSRHVRWALRLAVVSLVLLYTDRVDPLVSWSEARAGAGAVTVIATFFLLLATPGIVSAFRSGRRASGAALVLLCASCFVLSGSRAALLTAIMLWLWTLIQQARNRRRLFVVLAGVGMAGLLLHTTLRIARGIGPKGLLEVAQGDISLSDLLASGAASDASGGEFAIARYFVYATTVESSREFGTLTSLQRLLLIAVPRTQGWIDKPLDVTYRLWAKAFEQGLFDSAEGQRVLLESYLNGSLGSLHATLFGEAFITGGIGSLVLSVVVIGLVLAAIDRHFRHADPFTSLVLTGPVLVGFLMVARGNSVIGLGYFAYLSVLVVALRMLGSIARGAASICQCLYGQHILPEAT